MAAGALAAINANAAPINPSDEETQSVAEIKSLITGEWKTDTIQTFLGAVAYEYIFYNNGTGTSKTFQIIMDEPETTTSSIKWEIVDPTRIKIAADNATGIVKTLSVIDNSTIKLGGDVYRLVRKSAGTPRSNTSGKTGTTVKNQTVKKPSVKGKSKRKN